ncbi:MAG: transposase [Gammaproteobacteria bacterium]|nr:transposase [Gammaproteobacteria bacterium]
MNKHRYQAKELQQIDWERLGREVAGQRLVFSVDVAKENFCGAFLVSPQETLVTLKWRHPQQTDALGAYLRALPCSQIEVPLEPSGTYGDSLRGLLRGLGCEIYRVSPKRVHDAAEVYDGVPSLHDAKAAYLIGRLHLEGASQPWREAPAERREQQALIAELDLYQGEHRRNLNRLEALLARHWPELDRVAELNGAGVLRLIAAFGAPQAVREARAEAEVLLHHARRGIANPAQVTAILDSAEASLGLPCTAGERHLLQVLAGELLRTRKAILALQRRIVAQVNQDPVLRRIGQSFGKTTALVLGTTLGSPLDYPDPHAYLKAMGLNLKERSSGQHKGRLKITKRGPGRARHYLFLCAMRFVQKDAVIRAWYRRKVDRDGRLPRYNALVAVMRKLGLAIWHVARGAPFDSRKLFDLKSLGMAA